VIVVAVAAALFFGSIAYLGVYVSRQVCAGVAPADDGPAPVRAPAAVLIAGSAIVGAALVLLNAPPLQIGIAAIVVFALVACWLSDAICGLVPDLFTLVPLAALLLFALAHHDWGTIVSAVVVFIPFAAAAFFSRGYGMGWGDAKLVALTGAALGAPLALFALTVACAIAGIGHWIWGKGRTPIAFAPYIAAATGIALPLGLWH
jgi:prepilin signal peptidase PulO-like enzyme (type II secretory pathway)